MGLFDKIKNALFEEEYVEVEEKPKKIKKDSSSKIKDRAKKEEKEQSKPIAKKVVLPEKKEIPIDELEEEDLVDEDFEIQPKHRDRTQEVVEEKRNFKVMDDEDFKVEPEVVEPKIVQVIDQEAEKRNFSRSKNNHEYYPEKQKEKSAYGMNESSVLPAHEFGGAYERKEERTYFKPSPIISPIYGILDKNYKKEDVVPKREVRLTSTYARENLSVDDVRRKAYGDLGEDLKKEMSGLSHKEESTFAIEEDNLLVDLSKEEDKPSVKEVTMGDALEYFQDLGLEYNVDYVDASKEKTVGRRVKDNYDEVSGEKSNITKEEKEESVKKEKKDVEIDSDDNLFDLIDSMYKDED